jgi:hypothetical protein
MNFTIHSTDFTLEIVSTVMCVGDDSLRATAPQRLGDMGEHRTVTYGHERLGELVR